MTQVEDNEAKVKEKRVERKDKTVESPLFLLESDHNSEKGVEEDDNEKVDWVLEKSKARYDEIGFTNVPLLNYLHCHQILEGNAFPFRL